MSNLTAPPLPPPSPNQSTDRGGPWKEETPRTTLTAAPRVHKERPLLHKVHFNPAHDPCLTRLPDPQKKESQARVRKKVKH